MSTLRVELFHDDEAGNWHYREPPCKSTVAAPQPADKPSRTASPPLTSPSKATPATTTPTRKPSPST
jgi:hypothetical protein